VQLRQLTKSVNSKGDNVFRRVQCNKNRTSIIGKHLALSHEITFNSRLYLEIGRSYKAQVTNTDSY